MDSDMFAKILGQENKILEINYDRSPEPKFDKYLINKYQYKFIIQL